MTAIVAGDSITPAPELFLQTGYCKFCGHLKPLIDAHIVPDCFLDNLKHPSGPPMYVSKELTSRPTRIPTGFYDQNILCRECDNSFSGWEDYSASLLYRSSDAYAQSAQAGREGRAEFEIGAYDYAKLKLCILSITWKMSVSSCALSKNFTLGPFESDVLSMLKNKDAGGPDTYGMAVYRLFGNMASRSMQGPIRRRDSQTMLNFVLISIPGYMTVIKVDRRNVEQSSSRFTLAPQTPLVVGLEEYANLFENTKPIAFAALCRRGKKL